MARRFTHGFSLIETTIAIGIIGVMIVATGALLQRLPVSGREVRDQDLALKIARNEIEILRAAGFDALPVSGPFSHTLLDSLNGSAASVAVSDFGEKTKQTEVRVSWTAADGATRSVSLTTLITQNSGLP